jgi:Abnormal spindle-like microcephaly-assoc'd, ASPM-SPD-2-Hydin
MRPSSHRVQAFALPLVGLMTLLSGFALTSSPALADSYTCTNGAQGIAVPAGAAAADINLQGAGGQGNPFGVAGGLGGDVDMTLPVTAGDVLVIQVGCQTGFPDGGGALGPWAGSGGGSTSVRLDGTLFGVAGGGGGAGGQEGPTSFNFGAGGTGGNADGAGGAGNPGGADDPSVAGQSGNSGDTGGEPGAGGQNPGSGGGDGGFGGSPQGGFGGAPSAGADQLGGGGGGGGYVGGGGGGGGATDSAWSGGGGGGGGQSFVDSADGASQSALFSAVAGNGSITITYTYTGPVMVAPNPVEFGQVVSAGSNSDDQTVTMTDMGSGTDVPVTLGQVTVGGANAASFSVVGGTDNCSNATLANEQSCTVQVAYSPGAGSEEDDTGSLQFPSNSVVGTVTAALRGTAILPADMAAVPGALNFGGVATGTTATQTVAIYNTGDQRLDVGPPTITGADAPDFSIITQQNLCPPQLPAGGSCTLQVQFAPTLVTTSDATLQLTSANASTNGTIDIPLSGVGTLPVPPTPGTPGPQGNTGAQGPQGATGGSGTNGATGSNGSVGAPGAKGDPGTTGATGATGGIGTTGGQGPTGATGPAGQPGPPYKRLSGVTLRSNTLTACMGCLSKGLTLSYKLARSGHLYMTLERWSGGGWQPVGTKTLAAGAGLHHFAFDATFAGRPLHDGSYRLVVQSQSGAGLSKPVRLLFAITGM